MGWEGLIHGVLGIAQGLERLTADQEVQIPKVQYKCARKLSTSVMKVLFGREHKGSRKKNGPRHSSGKRLKRLIQMDRWLLPTV